MVLGFPRVGGGGGGRGVVWDVRRERCGADWASCGQRVVQYGHVRRVCVCVLSMQQSCLGVKRNSNLHPPPIAPFYFIHMRGTAHFNRSFWFYFLLPPALGGAPCGMNLGKPYLVRLK